MRRTIRRTVLLLTLTMVAYFGWRMATGWKFFLQVSHGDLLGTYEEIEVRAKGMRSSVRGTYGLEYECVELVNRYYVQVLGHRNMTKTGHADSYFWDATQKGLVAYPNGSHVIPQKHDILVFDEGDSDGSPGHVAIIVDVDVITGVVMIIQQNTIVRTDWVLRRDIWKDTLRLVRAEDVDGWYVDQGSYTIPVVGWSRLPAQH
jgi:hypothetical protein